MARDLFQAALAEHRAGRLEAALAGYAATIAAAPDFVDAHVNRGIIASQRGDAALALAALDRATALAPNRGDIAYNRGVALALADRKPEALAALDRALALGLDDPRVHLRRGEVLADLGETELALASFGEAVTRNDSLAEAWRGAADILVLTDRFALAATAYQRYLALRDSDPSAWSRYGIALQRLGADEEALAAFRRAVALAPGFSAGWNNIGEVLRDLGRFEEAVAALERAAATAEPGENAAQCQLLYTKGQLADWDGFAPERDRLLADFAAGRAQAVPFSMLRLVDDPAVHRESARQWLAALPQLPSPPLPAPGARLRIAYASADIHDHATMHLFGEVLAAHDRERFEVTLLSYGPPADDAWRRQAVAAVDRVIEAGTSTDAELAQQLRALSVELAVDLKGPTAAARPGIFACRAAPLQANWLGYPGTMPMPGMDYLIGDAVVVAATERQHVAEAVVNLPFGYQPNGRLGPLPLPPSRAAAGLPEGAFVFASFNQAYKILPDAFAGWMAILAAVPGSVLWLWSDLAPARANLRAFAAAHGVAPERLIFADRLPREAHLARLQHIDLFLDSGPYGAHTTASDALRAGVPVLTCPGRSFASRVAASLLTTLGLTELIVGDAATYHALAVKLARDPAALAAVRSRLTAATAGSPLYDPVRFCRALEAAYAAMIHRARAGQPPGDFTVSTDLTVQ